MRRTKMIHSALLRFVTASSMLFATILQGCGTTAPARFYTLSPVKEAMTEGRGLADKSRFTVGVGPVDIPDFLERPHIVTRNSGNEIVIAEYDRWAGSLKQDIARVLVEDLSVYLGPEVSVLSWKRGIPSDWRVAVEVTRLDVTPGREVVLGAQWALFAGDRKAPLELRGKTFTESLGGRDFSPAVTAIGNAVGRLSEEIAGDLRAQWRDKEEIHAK
jgi:uncharacterized lipoprotein YmbA